MGDCEAGFVCQFGGFHPEPHAAVSDASDGAYPCPEGLFCLKGATTTSTCPIGEFTFNLASIQESDCN